jgi:hypothetical protein
MQKLSGTSSGENNKSCGIFHHKSKNIEFAFFWFFYDFLHNLQESAKALYYFSYQFAGRPSKKFFFAMWSSGAGSGGLAAIPAGDRRIPAGGG